MSRVDPDLVPTRSDAIALEALARTVLEAPEASRGRMLSRRPDRWVVALDTLGVVVKAYARRRGLAGVLDFVFGDRAARTVRRGKTASARGITVARPIAYVRARTGAAVVLELARGENVRARARAKGRERRRLVVGLALFLRAIHDAKLYPGDFHQGNVLIDDDGNLTLLDLDGLRPVWFVSKRRRLRNLERLLRDFLGEHGVSRSTRMRFLRAYARSRAEARRLWGDIDRRFARKRVQYQLAEP